MKKKKRASESSKFVLNMSNGLIRLFFDVLFYVFISIAIVKTCRYAFDFCYQVFGPVAAAEKGEGEKKEEDKKKKIEFYIASGDSTKEVAKKLERNGLIKNALAFYLKTKLNKYNIQPGTYELNPEMTYGEILNVIATLSAVVPEEPIP